MLQANINIGFQTKTLVKNLQLDLPKGKFITIVGSNGSGKTTLLRTLCGLHQPLKGEVKLQNISLSQIPTEQLAKIMSLVTTDRIALRFFKVRDMISLGRQPYTGFMGRLRKEDHAIIEKVIQQVGIQSLVEKTLNELSDGERQKVMIARALVQNTPLILLDEPTAHLDIPNRFQIFKLLKNLSKQGKTIIMATHEVELALQLSDVMILFDSERKVTIDAPEVLIKKGIIDQLFLKDGITFQKEYGRFELLL